MKRDEFAIDGDLGLQNLQLCYESDELRKEVTESVIELERRYDNVKRRKSPRVQKFKKR